jgi:predicted nuclease with RNAse H fold
VSTVFEDGELLALVEKNSPVLVPMDAPLSLPPGRKSLADRNGEHLRPCDRVLQQMKIRFFPITLGPMRMLTERGLRLKEQMDGMGFKAVECYPGGAQDVWGIPRKQHDMEGLLKGLRKLGLRGLRKTANNHELDAASGALAGQWFLEGRGTMLGDETGILMPVVD